MLTLALIVLFSVATIASLLVVADSGLRGLNAWRGLRSELQDLARQADAQACDWDGNVIRLRQPANRATGSRRTVPAPARGFSAAA